MANILVTGANGFLGSWLTRELCKQGHQVNCLVRRSSDLSELEGIPVRYVYGDVTDLPSLEAAFQNIEFVFHLAGLIAYKRSDREKMDRINVGGTRNMIEMSLKHKVRRLVYLSSVVAVGSSYRPNEVLNESSAYSIQNLNLGYFETKRIAEALVKEACQTRGLDAVILNPSTIYGPGDAKKGSRKTQLKVAQGRFPFYTSGGVNVVSVIDVIQGILAAWQKGRSGERYILAGENITIKELFYLIAKAAGQPPPRLKMPDFLLHLLGIVGDILARFGYSFSLSRENAWTATMYHWFDSSKAQQELDFKPTKAHIAIESSVQWMRDHQLL